MRSPWIEDLWCPIFPEVAIPGTDQEEPGLCTENENGKGFSVLHILFVTWRRNLYCRILRSVNHYHHHPVLAILAKTSQVLWERSKLVKKLGMIGPVAQDYGQMPFSDIRGQHKWSQYDSMQFYDVNLVKRLDIFDRTWQAGDKSFAIRYFYLTEL